MTDITSLAKVRLLYIRRAADEDLSALGKLKLAEFLTPYELLRLEKFSRADLREQWLLARLLREFAFRTHWQLQNPELLLGDNGKPQLACGAGRHFNLAHHSQIIALALADAPVGVDVEMPQRKINRERLLAKHFSAAEAEKICASAEPDAQLLAHWCAKEAYLKARGAKIAGAQLQSMTVELGAVNTTGALVQPIGLPFAPNYCGQLWQADGALLALVTHAARLSAVIERVSAADAIALLAQ